MYVWKEMEPGTVLWLCRSIEHDRAPRSSRFVRFHTRYMAYVFTAVPHTNSTREDLMFSCDPG